jgi:hypothetical protein
VSSPFLTNTTHRRNDLARDIFAGAAANYVPSPVPVRDDDKPGDASRRMWSRLVDMAFDAADAFIAEEAARNPETNILDQMGHKP